MSFAALETSVDSGRPVELLQIHYSMQSWFYTTTESPVVYAGDTYVPLPMQTGNSQSTGDATKANRVIKLPHDAPVGNLYRIRPPSEVITVTLLGEHHLDNDYQVLWKGRVTSVNWQLPWLELNTESVFSSLLRPGLRRRFSIQCNHVLYSQKCGVSSATHKVTGLVTLVSGATLVIPAIAAAPADYYAGGYAEWVNIYTGAAERLMIVDSDPGSVVLTSAPAGLTDGGTVSVYPGCDHFLSTCATKFGNHLNNGSTPFFPTKNPFGGSMIY